MQEHGPNLERADIAASLRSRRVKVDNVSQLQRQKVPGNYDF